MYRKKRWCRWNKITNVQIKTAIIHKQNEISTANSIKDNRKKEKKKCKPEKFLYALQGHLIGPFPSGGPKYDIRWTEAPLRCSSNTPQKGNKKKIGTSTQRSKL